MILVTGWSDKLDGIAFISKAETEKEAFEEFCAVWNKTFFDLTKLVTQTDEFGTENTYLIKKEVEVPDFQGEAPGREGWVLYAEKEIEVGVVLQDMPW